MSEQGGPSVGSLGEEAARLFAALSDWTRETAGDIDEHLATGAAECTYCPVCRTVHVVRQLSPEVRAQLATGATALLQAAAGWVAAGVREERAERGGHAGVERIDLDDDPDAWPEETDAGNDAPEKGDR